MQLTVCLRGCLGGALVGKLLFDIFYQELQTDYYPRHNYYVNHDEHYAVNVEVGVKEGWVGLLHMEQVADKRHNWRIEEHAQGCAYRAQHAYADIYLVVGE